MTLKTPHVRTKPVRDALRFGPGLNAHVMVMNVAVEMANEMFEVYSKENAFHNKIRADGKTTDKAARRLFVERVAPRMLSEARQALTNMLTQPDDRVPLSMKDEIAAALILDNDLQAKRFVAADYASIPSTLH